MKVDQRLVGSILMVAALVLALGLLQGSGSSFWQGQASAAGRST